MKKLFTLCSFILFCSTAFAQIPNSNFELWDTLATYKSPKLWDDLDSLTNTLPMPVFTCERDSPSLGGNYYMKLTSKTTSLSVVAPGIAVSGRINFATTGYGPKSGFAFTGRPKSLNGQWQYMASGADQGHIAIYLSKWNTATSKRDTVAFTDHLLPGMVMSWAPFAINLKYYSNATPDSAIIVLSASGTTPVAGSYLYIDSLSFMGSVLHTARVTTSLASVTVYPNPASGYTNIAYYSNTESDMKINITDLSGRLVKAINTKAAQGDNNIPVNTSAFAPGVYFIRLVTDQGAEEQKLIIK